MEGKCVLMKKFSNLQAIDIEVEEKDPEKLCDIICRISCTFGAINLEDIKGILTLFSAIINIIFNI